MSFVSELHDTSRSCAHRYGVVAGCGAIRRYPGRSDTVAYPLFWASLVFVPLSPPPSLPLLYKRVRAGIHGLQNLTTFLLGFLTFCHPCARMSARAIRRVVCVMKPLTSLYSRTSLSSCSCVVFCHRLYLNSLLFLLCSHAHSCLHMRTLSGLAGWIVVLVILLLKPPVRVSLEHCPRHVYLQTCELWHR